MEILFISLIIIAIATIALNVIHFIKRRAESDLTSKNVQDFFILYHCLFIFALLIILITNITDADYSVISLSLAITTGSSLLAATFGLQPNFKNKILIGRLIIIIGFFIGIIFVIIDLITSVSMRTPVIILNAVLTVVSIGILIYYIIKIPISPLFGFLISTILLLIFHTVGIKDYNLRVLLYIVINIIMYFGYKNKYKFIEKLKKN